MINLNNNELCFVHFERECKCEYVDSSEEPRKEYTFVDILENGPPDCPYCGEKLKFIGVEIKQILSEWK